MATIKKQITRPISPAAARLISVVMIRLSGQTGGDNPVALLTADFRSSNFDFAAGATRLFDYHPDPTELTATLVNRITIDRGIVPEGTHGQKITDRGYQPVFRPCGPSASWQPRHEFCDVGFYSGPKSHGIRSVPWPPAPEQRYRRSGGETPPLQVAWTT